MITSSCLVCLRPCVLQQWGSRTWVHEDEEITFTSTDISNNYDHEAQPDILDLEGEEL